MSLEVVVTGAPGFSREIQEILTEIVIYSSDNAGMSPELTRIYIGDNAGVTVVTPGFSFRMFIKYSRSSDFR